MTAAPPSAASSGAASSAAAGVIDHPSARDWALLFVPGMVWGTSFFFIKEGLESFSAPLITPLRILFGFITLAMFPAARRASISRADLSRIAVLGVVWMAFPLSMFPFAEDGRVSSSVTGMLNGATPIFVAIVASIMASRLPSRQRAAGLAVGAVGMVVIALPEWGEGSSSAAGVLAILAALCSYGLAINLAIPLQQRYGSLPVLWRAQAVALVAVAPFGITSVDDVTLRWWPVLAVVLLGAGGTALAYVLTASNAGRMGSTRASVTTYIIPVVSLLLGALFANESVAWLSVVGCAIAMAGAFIVGRTRM